MYYLGPNTIQYKYKQQNTTDGWWLKSGKVSEPSVIHATIVNSVSMHLGNAERRVSVIVVRSPDLESAENGIDYSLF